MIINLMTTDEVAEKLRCSKHYVSQLRKQKAFNGFKVGKRWMYKESEVIAYINRSLEEQLSQIRSDEVNMNALSRGM